MTLTSLVAENVLAALARFRILTLPQLLQITGHDEKTLRQRVRELVTASLVGRREFRLGRVSGRLPNTYWLTPKGCEWVREAMGVIVKPRPDNKPLSQLPHRTLTVDALIAADIWARSAGQKPPAFNLYMEADTTRLALPSKVAIADAVFRLQDSHGACRTFVMEIYCDYQRNATNRPYEQLEPYVQAGFGDALDNALGIPTHGKAAMVLVICDTEATSERIRKGLPKRPGMPPLDRRTWKRFLFKPADALQDFGHAWRRVDGEIVNLQA